MITSYFDVFADMAKVRLNEIAACLERNGRTVGPVYPVEEIGGKGYGFRVDNNRQLFVELLLKEEEHSVLGGGVGITLTCSVRESGLAWVPRNFVPNSPNDAAQVITECLLALNVDEVTESILSEWSEIEVDQLEHESNAP